MFRIPAASKLLFAALAVSATIAAVQPASAQPYHWGPHPHWAHPYWRPVYVGPHCFARRVWVRTPFGPRLVVQRFCR
jgi:hypothetical protein